MAVFMEIVEIFPRGKLSLNEDVGVDDRSAAFEYI